MNCHMVMLQRSPPMGHVFTLHLHSFGVYQEKGIHCVLIKTHNCTRRVKLTWEKINTLNPK